MKLSSDLISRFVKATQDTKTETKPETTIYGTIVAEDTDKSVYVRFDGADNDTRIDCNNIESTVEVAKGDRVIVRIKNHTATIVGNITPGNRSVGRSVAETVSTNTTNATFNTLIVDYVKAEELKAEAARITLLEADVVKINNTLVADYVKADTLFGEEGRITKLESEVANIDTVYAKKAEIENVYAKTADVENLYAKKAEIESVYAKTADVDNVYAKKADIENLESDVANIDDLYAKKAEVTSLKSEIADIDTLIFGSATGSTIQTSFANAVIAQLGNAQIKSAMIESVSANKVTAGDIITDNVHIKSSDGKLLISDETIQISDNTRVRVQIGKDAAGDYSINIWDSDGQLMFSEGGITDNAIKDAIIRNDMVSENANISASKLDIDSLFEEINGSTNTIKSTKVYLDDEKQTLDVAFKSLENTVADQGETITSQGTSISTIQGQIESKIWQQDINTARNELLEETETLSTKYSTLEQEVDSISSTVASHTTLINKKADSTTVTTVENKVSALEQDLDGFQSTVSSTYATKSALSTTDTKASAAATTAANAQKAADDAQDDVDNLTARVSTAETNISQNTQAITLRATKTEVETAKTEAISTASSDATTKANNALSSANANTTNVLKNYSTTSEMKAAIEVSADAIESSVSSTYATKTALSVTDANVAEAQKSADAAQSDIDNLEIGGRNLLRNTTSESRTTTFSGWQRYFSSEFPFITSHLYRVTETQELTLSAYIENVSGTEPVGLMIHIVTPDTTTGYKQIVSTQKVAAGESGWISVTGKVSVANVTNVWAGLRHYASSATDNTVKYHSVKMEFGNKATDWTPAPEDTDALIDGLDTRVSSAESSITQLSDKITANVQTTTDLGTRMSTIEQTADGLSVRLDSTETLLSDVEETADNAAKTATNFLSYDSTNGLLVGNKTSGSWSGNRAQILPTEFNILDSSGTELASFGTTATIGKASGSNVYIDSDSVDIRNGTTTLASFGANTIYLGKNSDTSVINLCNGSATMKVVDDTDFRIYTDKRLVMSAYQSMLLDCYRDSTHMTRIAIQSSDPDQSSFVGGVSFTIYQDTIQNTVQMLGNDIILKVTDGTDTTRLTIQEDAAKIYTSGRLYLNSSSNLQIGESSSYSYSVTLGNTYNKAKSIRCYWNDGKEYDLVSQASNGQNSFFGPANIAITDSSNLTSTTNIRGKYVRLYNHSGGGVYLGSSGSTAVTSDKNLKKDILDIDDKYLVFFDRLRPITYKYDCPENKGHRDHIGFIAQEVEEALTDSGLTTEQFAGLVIERDVTLNPNYDSSLSDEENAANETHYDTLYSLRYEEFISLLVKKVQSLQEQINQLRSDT